MRITKATIIHTFDASPVAQVDAGSMMPLLNIQLQTKL